MKGLFFILLAALPPTLLAQDFTPLWEEGEMPNSRGIPMTDSVENGRWRRVAVPGYFHFRPAKEEDTGAAVVICPPGGYGHHTYELAGFQFAKWFNTRGLHAFVLIHRLPHSPDLIERSTGPLVDARRMMELIRGNADAWGIDPGRVGAMGSSAGGHLAATLATDREDTAPDFLILISPVITMENEYTHKGSVRNLLGENPSAELRERFSNEKQVKSFTPPTFLTHADNDRTVPAWNSVLFYSALKRAGIPASLHIFPQGGHAIALRNNPGSTRLWTDLCEAWLYEMKIVE